MSKEELFAEDELPAAYAEGETAAAEEAKPAKKKAAPRKKKAASEEPAPEPSASE